MSHPNDALFALSDDELKALTPLKARDLVVRCFFNAQQAAFRRAAERIRSAPTPHELQSQVEGAVRMAFRTARADFENPTKATLLEAVRILAHKAAVMGTPADLIEHHKTQLARIFAALADE